MTPIEKQILKNQSRILSILSDLSKDDTGHTIHRINETQELLNPTNEEDCCEMPEEDEIVVEVSKSEGCGKQGFHSKNWKNEITNLTCGKNGFLCPSCKDFVNSTNSEVKEE